MIIEKLAVDKIPTCIYKYTRTLLYTITHACYRT
jgi:hypothetical protein